MTSPAIGIVFNRESFDPRPAQPSDLSIIGLVLPSDDADADFFPLNEPVVFDSGDSTWLPRLGSGDLARAVMAIDDQLYDLQTSARIVAVRVAQGEDDAETIANIVGSRMVTTAAGNVGTGLYALLRSGVQNGVIPRLLGAPGYTWQTTTVDGELQANPICAALPSICSALLAHAVVGAPGEGNVTASQWFETLTSGRLIAIDAWRRVSDGEGSTRLEDGVAAVLGLGARVDFRHGGYPFWSFSGQQVNGTIGLKNYYPFSLVDGATEAQELLANHIGVIVRGEVGVETSVANNGFVFTGVWNADTDPLWWFYNKTRGRDWAHLALLKSIRLRLGVENVTPHGVQAVLNDMVAIGQDMIRNECSVGFKVGFEAAKNSPDDLRQGKFRVFFATEEPAPITRVWIDSRPNYEALVAELGTLVAQAATLPAVNL